MTRPRKNPGASGIRTWDLSLSRQTPQPLGQRGGLSLPDDEFNLFLAVTRKFSVLMGTLLYLVGSCERHSEPTKEIAHPFEADTDGRYSLVVCINWATNRNWQTKMLDTRQITKLMLVRQESIMKTFSITCRCPFSKT